MLYTGTGVYLKYNKDKRLFYNKSLDSEAVPRFPVLDKLLMEARFCLPPVSNQPDEVHPVLWCGMRDVFLSNEGVERGQFRLAQDTSFSRSEETGRRFLQQGAGTLFKVSAKVHDTSIEGVNYIQQDQMFFGDVSWISIWGDTEEETLVEAGMQIDIQSITVVSDSPYGPYVELVEGVLRVGIERIDTE